ncbi:hypothetical protein HZB60_06530 [candidate division KSB1 bacterium]|nr:hypothetical protein [candidate division KSB1 bacterium]
MSGLIFLAGTSSLRSTRETQTTAVELDHTRAFYAAEAAVEEGSEELRTLLENVIDPSSDQVAGLVRPTIGEYTIENFDVDKVGPLTQENITAGDYQGLIGFVQRYTIAARAQSGKRSSQVWREIQHQFIPLFQFGVFYENDLEIFPGVAMTFVGPIHTNANLYMGSGASIACNSTVTAVGYYYHYRKDNGVDEAGPVTVTNGFGVPQNVWRGSYWLDERRPTWQQDALALWTGNFRDRSHGLTTLRLPLPPTDNQHKIIERPLPGDNATDRNAKYWYKASVRYLDGAITDSSGAVISMPGVFSYTQNQFTDARESRVVDVLNIDIGAMIAGGYSPPNGIMYVSHTNGDRAVVRLKNAATLPVGGLTIVTDRPLYTQGHFNSVAKKGAALMCDAITLLSPNWNDALSAGTMSARIPTALTVNACVMAGHVVTVGTTYSGGLENSFRFLENWSGVTVTFRGSIVHLWSSVYNIGSWRYGSPVYNAPRRVWGFDTDLLQPGNWPPGTPRVQTVQRGAWKQIS